jgi:hypothetical protein
MIDCSDRLFSKAIHKKPKNANRMVSNLDLLVIFLE